MKTLLTVLLFVGVSLAEPPPVDYNQPPTFAFIGGVMRVIPHAQIINNGGSGSVAFSSITTGTNTAALHIGTNGTLDATGTGTITATGLGTLSQNLLFTDATYDIGADGATRPRNIYFSGALLGVAQAADATPVANEAMKWTGGVWVLATTTDLSDPSMTIAYASAASSLVRPQGVGSQISAVASGAVVEGQYALLSGSVNGQLVSSATCTAGQRYFGTWAATAAAGTRLLNYTPGMCSASSTNTQTVITADSTGSGSANYQTLTAGTGITLTPNAGAHTNTVASTGAWKFICNPQFSTTDTLDAATITTTETGFATLCQVPSSYLVANKAIRVTYILDVKATGGPTFSFKIKWGGSAGATPGGTAIYSNNPNIVATTSAAFRTIGIEFIIQGTAAAGASVNVETGPNTGGLLVNSGSSPFTANFTGQPVAVATNAAENIVLSLTYSAGTAGNVVTLRQAIFEGTY